MKKLIAATFPVRKWHGAEIFRYLFRIVLLIALYGHGFKKNVETNNSGEP